MSEPIIKAETAFVGREPELSQLRQALKAVIATNRPNFVFVKGDYGVGKTTLVEHFLAEVSAKKDPLFLIGRGKCAMESEDNGRVPFAQLFKSLSNQGIKYIGWSEIGKFAKEVAPAWLDIVTLGAASAAMKTIDESNKLFKGGAFSKENVYVQFTNAISRLTEKYPAVAFIDDLQWADISSLELLFHLASNLKDRAVLFILTYRPADVLEKAANASLFRKVHVNLKRYGAKEFEVKEGIDVTQYVDQRYPSNAFPPDLIKRVQERTGGHALFVDQVFSLWEEKGTIIECPTANGLSEWGVAEDADVQFAVPESLGDVLEERIQSMEDELREILVYASVEGDDFTVQTIARLHQVNEDKTFDDLRLLDRQYFMVQENGPKQVGQNVFDFYHFTQRFFREYVYDQLSSGKKRILHRKVGECLEALYTDHREIAGQLARHFREALDPMKSAQYALMAAQFEQSHYAWDEGEYWCKFGLELVDQLPATLQTAQLQINLLEQSGYGNFIHGNYSLADERYRKALAMAQDQGDPLRVAELCDRLVYLCFDEGKIDEAVGLLEQARQVLSDGAVPMGELSLDIEENWAFTQARYGKHELAVTALRKVLSDTQTLPQTASLDLIKREIYSGLGVTLSDLNRYEEAIAAYRESAKIDERLGMENQLAIDLLNEGDAYVRIGDLKQSMAYAIRGEKIATRIGESDNLAYAKSVKGDTFLALGSWQDAIREFSEAISISERSGSAWDLAHSYAAMALAYRAVPDLDTAYQKATRAVEYTQKASYQFEYGYAMDALAQVEASRQEWEPARLHFTQAIVNFQEEGARHFAGRSQCHLAEMLIAQGNRHEAIELAKEAMQVFQELNLPHEIKRAQEVLDAAVAE